MKNKLKVLALTLLIVVGFVLGACSQSQSFADQLNPIKIWPHNTNGAYNTLLVIDENTGVNYIVVSSRWSTGHSPDTIAITPRLNADGTIYISK